MKNKPRLWLAGLILATLAAMAAAGRFDSAASHFRRGVRVDPAVAKGIVSLSASLVQPKVLVGTQGNVTLALTLSAEEPGPSERADRPAVDLTVVLDRSGSMQGEKLEHACRALQHLISDLSEPDRLALVSYADGVERHSGLLSMTAANRRFLAGTVERIRAGGGTNLGAGLQAGIQAMAAAETGPRIGQVLLISDGLANQGITDPMALARMAQAACERGFTVGTAGVGLDFNEQLMTLIAESGAGRYAYIENPEAFAALFAGTYRRLQDIVASDVVLKISPKPGTRLIDASGYPIQIEGPQAWIRPGNLRSGQSRTLYLTFQVPTGEIGQIELGRMAVHYTHAGAGYATELDEPLQVACVKDEKEVMASIEKKTWARTVLDNDYHRLKQDIAADIKAGEQDKALERLDSYRSRQAQINAFVGSGEVQRNLDEEVEGLRSVVKETFQGAPAAVVQKQKQNSKSLHYEGYQGQRNSAP